MPALPRSTPRLPRAPTTAALLLLGALLLAAPGALAEEAAPDATPPAVPVHGALQPLRAWLAHEDWTLRSIAAFELRARTEVGAVHLAARMLAREKHAYAAAGALGALRGRPRRELVAEGGAELVDALLRWARDAHPTVRADAREGLFTLPPVKLGTDLAVYDGWWARGRRSYDLEQRSFLEVLRGDAEKAARAQGEKSTSTQTDRKDDRFYGRLELMRRYGLELCVVMDHTGSMSPVIGAAKTGAARLIARLRAYVPRFRAGLVTYDDGARLRAPLTDNGALLAKAVDRVGAGGGADYEEGVDKGIELALAQGRLGWSQRAYRVVVVIGDAPPHEADVPGLLRGLARARQDELYDEPIVVHTVSTGDLPVLHFPQIALAGGGQHVTLRQTGRLVEELVLAAFGGAERERVQAWMAEIDKLRKAEP